MELITALGWLGTALVLTSYTQTNLRRLRRLSLVASLVLIIFNAALGVWSNVVLEVALVGINLHLLRRERPDLAADRGPCCAIETTSAGVETATKAAGPMAVTTTV